MSTFFIFVMGAIFNIDIFWFSFTNSNTVFVQATVEPERQPSPKIKMDITKTLISCGLPISAQWHVNPQRKMKEIIYS